MAEKRRRILPGADQPVRRHLSELGTRRFQKDGSGLLCPGPTPSIRGEITTLEGRKPLSSFEYFTVGMSTMFLLHAAAFTARLASEERENRALDRIALAGVPARRFWAGKWLSTFLLALIQLFTLFGYAALAFDVTWKNPASFLVVTFLLAFVAGSLAVFLMALSFRFNTSWVVELFSTGSSSSSDFSGAASSKWTSFRSGWPGWANGSPTARR